MKIAPLSLADQEVWAELLATSFNREPEQMRQLLHFLQPDKLVAWGAWDGARLAAQYSCLVTAVSNPARPEPIPVGMSINMAVHPDYRGRGLIKQVSRPVYDQLLQNGVLAGVGFSNATGVRVDKQSKGYGYQVLGQLRPYLAILRQQTHCPPLTLSTTWPQHPICIPRDTHHFQLAATPASVQHRFACHPFRQYYFATWEEANQVHGLVIYRPTNLHGIRAVALLAVYGNDLPNLLNRWSTTMCQRGFRIVQLVATPTACVLDVLGKTAVLLPQPKSRTPYYLTLKPLSPALPPSILDYAQWDCLGGDIL